MPDGRGPASPMVPAPPAAARAGGRTAWLWLAYLALALVLGAPMIGVDVPLGVDTLNHLARAHVRAHLADDPDLARLFALRDGLVPYMGLDWMLDPLTRVLPTLDAGRAATVLLVWGLVGAAVVLQRAVTGRVGAGPLLAGLAGWNALMAWGLLGYVVGVIGALLGLAAWHAMRDRPRLLRLAMFTAAATALYFVQLLGLALYGVLIGFYEAFGRPRAWRTPARDWLLLGAQFVPAGMLWLQLARSLPDGDGGMAWPLAAKAAALLSPVLFAGANGGFDPGVLLVVPCLLVLVRLTRTGALRWDRRLAAPAAALMAFSMAVPTQAFDMTLLDLRFPTVAAVLAAASVQAAPGAGRRLAPLGALLALALLAQAGSAGSEMRACSGQYAELRAALQAVPRGAVLGAVLEYEHPEPAIPCTSLPIYLHMPQLVTLDRSGISQDYFSRLKSVAAREGLLADVEPWRAHLVTRDTLTPGGHLLWMHLGHRRPVPAGLALLRNGSFFDLYEIR